MWEMVQAGARAAGGASDAMARNRGTKFEGQMDLEQLLMLRDQQQFGNSVTREQEGRASGMDAWRKLIAAERTGNPGPRPQLAGQYSVAQRQPAEREMYGAHLMAEEAMKRLTGGNPIQPMKERPLEVDRRLLNASKWEKILGTIAALGGGR